MSETHETAPAPAGPSGLPMARAAGVAIALVAIIFVSLNVIAQSWLGGPKLDLTENRIYTLSDGSKQLAGSLDEPITLTFFYSRAAASDYPQIGAYAARVRELLKALEARAGGKLLLRFVEPEPFSAEEDEAAAAGLTAVPTGGEASLYFGLAGENAIDGREAIAFFSPEREAFLEYDVAQMLDRLNTPEPPRIGLLTALPLATGPGGPMAAFQGGRGPMQIYELLDDVYDIKTLPEDLTADDLDDVDAIFIAQPPAIGAAGVKAIDQFVLKGGRALILLDPAAGLDAGAPGAMGPDGPIPGPGGDADALAPLLAAWGVDFQSDQVVLDQARALRVAINQDGRYVERSFPLWLGLTDADRDGADPAVADLSRAINFASVGSLAAVEGADTVFSPLIQTTDRAMTIDAARVAFNPQPDELLRDYLPGGEALTIAARISGPATSPFVDASELDKSAASTDDEDAAPPTAVAEGTINVIVVADTDFLDDQFFARDNGLFVQITADNASFVLNALDNLLGSDALLALRARSPSDRPMTAVQELRARAETQYLIEEQRLQAELQATEARLSELETQPGEEGAAGFALSPQQEAEVRRFQNEMAGIRRDLRAVQRRLNADIEGLKGWLMFFNIWTVPLGLGAALWLGRGRGRRGGRGATS